MIVVIGTLVGRLDAEGTIEHAGFAAALASAAAAKGADVQVVARIGDDDVGDKVLLGLAAERVGHVATLRDAGRRTALIRDDEDENPGAEAAPRDAVLGDGPTLEAADVGLAMRYLSDYRVIVLAHTADPALIGEAATAAGWAGAHLVVVTSPSESLDMTLPGDALVLSAGPDADGLAVRLGRYAAAIDAGESADTAYAVLTEANTES